MKPGKQFTAALCLALTAFSTAHATVTTGTGGSGVTVGSSSLIGQLQYSDTFTGTADGSANPSRPYIAAVQPAAAYPVENLYGNPAQNWGSSPSATVGSFSFASDRVPGTPGLINGVPAYPGFGVNQNTSGSGSLTGITQTGSGVDYGISASHRNHFVAQFDAIQTNDRIDITSGTSTNGGTIGNAGGPTLSVFFRPTGNANEISLYNGVTDTTTPLTSGVTNGTWNNYAVRFDRVNNQLEVFTNEVSRGTVNLATFAGGIYQNFGTTAVSFGGNPGAGQNRIWSDNAQIGNAIGSADVPNAPASLISYWNFNEAASGSTVSFDSQHANNGIAANLHTTGLTGSGAAAINGVAANSINVTAGGGNNFATPNGITIEAQFTIPASFATTPTEAEFFRKNDGGNLMLLSFQSGANINNSIGADTGFAGISFGLNTSGYSEMDIEFDGLNGRPTFAQLADGREHYIAATYDSTNGNKAIYIDGILIALLDLANNTITNGGTAPAFIGSSGGGAEPFPGVLDEVAIYNAPLSSSTIALHNQLLAYNGSLFQPLTSLPEPSSFAAFGLVAAAGIGYAMRRRQTAK